MEKNIHCEFERTQLLFGSDAMDKIYNSHVAVFGIGGVGGYVVEALARSGVGKLDLIDNDTVSITNINRQIVAYHSTIGKYKTDVAKQRIMDINPDAQVNTYKCFYLPENSSDFDFSKYDYVVDCIDTVSGKIELAVNAQKCSTPIISSMGAGNKLDPTAFEVADIFETSVCPLSKVMRKLCKENNIRKLKVVYSKEAAISPKYTDEMKAELLLSGHRQIPGSNAFVPSVVGLIIAGEVIKDLCGFNRGGIIEKRT